MGSQYIARLRRSWVKLGVLSTVVALIGLASSWLLLIEDDAWDSASPPTAAAQPAPEPAPAPLPTQPPLDRPPLQAPDLPPLARGWRKAIILGKRRAILAGAFALREAEDGKEQLLLLAKDNNERIRAYSFRELGLRKDPELLPLFEAGRSDASPYVRENAEWAIGLLRATK